MHVRARQMAGFLLALAGSAGGVLAQESTGVAGSLSLGAGWTTLVDDAAVQVGGSAAVHFGGRWTLGGFGYGLAERVEISGGSLPEDMSFGYGGVFGSVVLARPGSTAIGAHLLLGAGNAQIRAQPIGNQLGSDNFLVAEPRLNVALPNRTPVRAALEVGYRLVFGVQDLTTVTDRDLEALTVSLSVSLGGQR